MAHKVYTIFGETQVLSMLSQGEKTEYPAPFPLSKQNALEEKSEAASDDESHVGEPNKTPADKKLKKGVKRCGQHKAEEYKAARMNMIRELRSAGKSFKQASVAWDASEVKRGYLKLVPLPELKKRRFVGKECTANPWA